MRRIDGDANRLGHAPGSRAADVHAPVPERAIQAPIGYLSLLHAPLREAGSAVDAQPACAMAFYSRGTAHYISGSLKMALADLRKVGDSDPTCIFAYLARTRLGAGEAAASRAQAFYFIGFRKVMAGDEDGARESFRKCVETRVDSTVTYRSVVE